MTTPSIDKISSLKEGYPHVCGCCNIDQENIEFLLAAFNIMRDIAMIEKNPDVVDQSFENLMITQYLDKK